MRRRDVVAVCVLFGGVVAAVAWALSTQARWVQENKPLVVQPRPAGESPEGKPPPTDSTGVVGAITQDTRDAMARDLEARKQVGKAPKPRRPTP